MGRNVTRDSQSQYMRLPSIGETLYGAQTLLLMFFLVGYGVTHTDCNIFLIQTC